MLLRRQTSSMSHSFRNSLNHFFEEQLFLQDSLASNFLHLPFSVRRSQSFIFSHLLIALIEYAASAPNLSCTNCFILQNELSENGHSEHLNARSLISSVFALSRHQPCAKQRRPSIVIFRSASVIKPFPLSIWYILSAF